MSGSNLRGVDLEQRAGRVDSGDERHVSGLVAALGEVHREGRLRGPGDAGQHEVGLIEGSLIRTAAWKKPMIRHCLNTASAPLATAL